MPLRPRRCGGVTAEGPPNAPASRVGVAFTVPARSIRRNQGFVAGQLPCCDRHRQFAAVPREPIPHPVDGRSSNHLFQTRMPPVAPVFARNPRGWLPWAGCRPVDPVQRAAGGRAGRLDTIAPLVDGERDPIGTTRPACATGNRVRAVFCCCWHRCAGRTTVAHQHRQSVRFAEAFLRGMAIGIGDRVGRFAIFSRVACWRTWARQRSPHAACGRSGLLLLGFQLRASVEEMFRLVAVFGGGAQGQYRVGGAAAVSLAFCLHYSPHRSPAGRRRHAVVLAVPPACGRCTSGA